MNLLINLEMIIKEYVEPSLIVTVLMLAMHSGVGIFHLQAPAYSTIASSELKSGEMLTIHSDCCVLRMYTLYPIFKIYQYQEVWIFYT